MNKNWNFPDYSFGRRDGISNPGVETFRGDRYMHLAKEICQNSLDASKDKTKPVKISFNHFYTDVDSIPGSERYLEVFHLCNEMSKKGNSEKEKDFFQYANKLLEKDQVSVLRISDFNTTGLTGSKQEKDTPWHDLIKAAGRSNKGGDAGGSFGIGKYAAFACSNLRTVFYSTYDNEGISAYQGVTEVINFIDRDGIEKDNEGYYGIGKKNEAIPEELVLDPNYSRSNRTGTDIYIVGFIEQGNWMESMIYAIVDSFLIAIYNGELEVEIGDTLINKDNLEDILTNKLTYNKSSRTNSPLEFYNVLTSKEAHVETYPLYKENKEYLGDFKLYLLIDNDLTTRRVLMSRINGMKVFEQGRLPSGIPFAGICILQDRNINSYFRKMETPEHDAWKADQFSEDPKEIREADETRLILYRFIRDTLNDLASQTELDEVDVEGLGDYLPDLEDDFLGSITKENLSGDKEREVNIKLEELEDKIERPIYEEEEVEGGRKIKGEDGKGNKEKNQGIKDFDGDGKGISRVATDKVNIRLFQTDVNNYRLILNPNEELEDVELSIEVVGEDNRTRETVELNSVKLDNKDNVSYSKNNRIRLGNLKKDTPLLVNFSPKILEQLSMEVIIYEN